MVYASIFARAAHVTEVEPARDTLGDKTPLGQAVTRDQKASIETRATKIHVQTVTRTFSFTSRSTR